MVFDHQNTTFIITREDLDFGPVTLVTEAVTIGRKREADIVLDDPSVAIYAGPRRGELLKLAWSNVDFGLNLINFTETKTNRDRAVPMESIVREALFELRKQNGNAEYVFTNPDTGTRYTDIKRSFSAACREAGITNFTFHDLRHTFGTRLADAGVDVVRSKS